MTEQLTRPAVDPEVITADRPAPISSRRRRPRADDEGRTITSPHAAGTRRGRIVYWICWAAMAVGLTVIALGPLFWMVSGSFKSTPELVRSDPDLLPHPAEPGNYSYALQHLNLLRYLLNTVLLAVGGLVFQVVVSVLSAYTFAILKPAGSRVWFAMMTATLFIPATVIFIPTYVTVVDFGLINNPLAVWLPEAATAFNVFILKRFFDNLPGEVIQAAQVDGAGPLRLLLHIVLPMSRPILAVVSLFAIIASWKAFLWPKVTLPDPIRQPLSVALDLMQQDVELKYILAALVLASIPPVVIFLIFQRRIVGGLADAGLGR